MKTLLDEQLSPRIARVLRQRGLDVVAAAERADPREATDRDVMDAAARDGRTFTYLFGAISLASAAHFGKCSVQLDRASTEQNHEEQPRSTYASCRL